MLCEYAFVLSLCFCAHEDTQRIATEDLCVFIKEHRSISARPVLKREHTDDQSLNENDVYQKKVKSSTGYTTKPCVVCILKIDESQNSTFCSVKEEKKDATKSEPSERLTSALEIKSEPKERVMTVPEIKSEPKERVMTAPEIKSEPKERVMASPEIKSEPKERVMTAPEVKSEPVESSLYEKITSGFMFEEEDNEAESSEALELCSEVSSDNEETWSLRNKKQLEDYYVRLVLLMPNDFVVDSVENVYVNPEITSIRLKNEIFSKSMRNKTRMIRYSLQSKNNITESSILRNKKEPLHEQKALCYRPNHTKEYKERLYNRFWLLLQGSSNDISQNESPNYKKHAKTLKLNSKNECLPDKDEYDFITGGVFNDEELTIRYNLFVEVYKLLRYCIRYGSKPFKLCALDLLEELIYSSTQVDDKMFSFYLNAIAKTTKKTKGTRARNKNNVSHRGSNLKTSFFYAVKTILKKTFVEKKMSINHNCFKAFIEVFNIMSNKSTILHNEIDPKIQSAILFYLYRDLSIFYRDVDYIEVEYYIKKYAKAVFIHHPTGLNRKICLRIVQNLLLFSEIFVLNEKKTVCINYTCSELKRKVLRELLAYKKKFELIKDDRIDEAMLELLHIIYTATCES